MWTRTFPVVSAEEQARQGEKASDGLVDQFQPTLGITGAALGCQIPGPGAMGQVESDLEGESPIEEAAGGGQGGLCIGWFAFGRCAAK